MGATPTSTQSRHPVRAVVRTVFAFVAAVALIIPIIVAETGLNPEVYPWLGAVVGVAAFVTRVLASPAVNAFLQRWVYTSWLAATPADEVEVEVVRVTEGDQPW